MPKTRENLRCLKSAFPALSVLPVTPMALWRRSGYMWTISAGMSQSVWVWIIASGWHFIWDTSVRGVVALNSLHRWWEESCFQREGQGSCTCVWRCLSFGASRTRLLIGVQLIGASAHSQVWTSSLCAHKQQSPGIWGEQGMLCFQKPLLELKSLVKIMKLVQPHKAKTFFPIIF